MDRQADIPTPLSSKLQKWSTAGVILIANHLLLFLLFEGYFKTPPFPKSKLFIDSILPPYLYLAFIILGMLIAHVTFILLVSFLIFKSRERGWKKQDFLLMLFTFPYAVLTAIFYTSFTHEVWVEIVVHKMTILQSLFF